MPEDQRVFVFSDFCLDPTNETLRKGGVLIPLTPKAFETLTLLVENCGEIVTRDQLIERIWHGRFVEDGNISFNVKVIRKALNDDARSPKFIETLPRKGYRFIAQVEESRIKVKTSNRQARRQMLVPYFVTAVILFAVAASFALYRFGRQGNDQLPLLATQFNSIRLSDTGRTLHSTISTDGRFVAFVSEVNNKQSLRLRQLENGNNTQIVAPSDQLFYGVSFSRDGESIYFTRKFDQANNLAIFRVPVLGGIPTRIAEFTQGGIAVSPDGEKLAYIRYAPGGRPVNSIFVANADGKNERIVRQSEDGQVFWAHTFNRNGSKIIAAYGHTIGASKAMRLVEVDIATGEQTDLAMDRRFFSISGIQTLPDGSGLLFSGMESLGSVSRIWKLDIVNNACIQMTHDSWSYGDFSIDEDAEKLVADVVTADFSLRVGDLQGHAEPQKLTQARDGFDFLPDGRIVYASDAAGSEDIWIMDADGGNQRQLTTDVSLDAYPISSPDAQFVYYSSNRNGKNQIWRVDVGGGSERLLSENEGGFARFVSPDGQWVYFENAMNRMVWRVPSSGGHEELVFPEKLGYYHAFSPDGSQIAYLNKDKQTNKYSLSVRPLDPNVNGTIWSYDTANHEAPYYLNWSPDGRFLSYATSHDDRNEVLWIQDVSNGTAEDVRKIAGTSINDFRLSPNGKQYGIISGLWKHDGVLITGLK